MILTQVWHVLCTICELLLLLLLLTQVTPRAHTQLLVWILSTHGLINIVHKGWECILILSIHFT